MAHLPLAPAYRPQVLCVALVGKNDNPLYVRTFSQLQAQQQASQQQDLRFMYMVHTSLDIVEERVASGSKASEMYLGLLYTIEDIRIYGYMTNTKIKFIVIIQGGQTNEGPLKESELRLLFNRLHTEYTNLIYNPFYDVSATKVVSPLFDSSVESLVINSGL